MRTPKSGEQDGGGTHAWPLAEGTVVVTPLTGQGQQHRDTTPGWDTWMVMSGTHGITRAMCLPPHTVLLAQMPRARASLSPSPFTEPPPKGVTELGTVGPTSRAADPGDTLLLRHQNNWGDPHTPKPRDTHFRVWGAGIPQQGLPRREGNSVDPKTEGTPPNSLPAAPPKLRRPHAAAPRAPAARGPPTPRPFTLYHAHPPLIGQDSPRPFSLPRRHGRPPMNGGVPSSVCDVIDDVMYRPMGGGEAGLRGKQTPHVAAAGRGTRAGGDTGEGGGTASGPPLPVRREPRHARHRLGRPRAARSRGPGAADRDAPVPPRSPPVTPIGPAARYTPIPVRCPAVPVPGTAPSRCPRRQHPDPLHSPPVLLPKRQQSLLSSFLPPRPGVLLPSPYSPAFGNPRSRSPGHPGPAALHSDPAVRDLPDHRSPFSAFLPPRPARSGVRDTPVRSPSLLPRSPEHPGAGVHLVPVCKTPGTGAQPSLPSSRGHPCPAVRALPRSAGPPGPGRTEPRSGTRSQRASCPVGRAGPLGPGVWTPPTRVSSAQPLSAVPGLCPPIRSGAGARTVVPGVGGSGGALTCAAGLGGRHPVPAP